MFYQMGQVDIYFDENRFLKSCNIRELNCGVVDVPHFNNNSTISSEVKLINTRYDIVGTDSEYDVLQESQDLLGGLMKLHVGYYLCGDGVKLLYKNGVFQAYNNPILYTFGDYYKLVNANTPKVYAIKCQNHNLPVKIIADTEIARKLYKGQEIIYDGDYLVIKEKNGNG